MFVYFVNFCYPLLGIFLVSGVLINLINLGISFSTSVRKLKDPTSKECILKWIRSLVNMNRDRKIETLFRIDTHQLRDCHLFNLD